MSARRGLSIPLALAAGGLAIACVDLFHATDFETLCTREPGSAACGDAGAPGANLVPPDLCALAGSDPARAAARACGWLGACAGPLDASRFGPCVLAARLVFDCQANPSLRPRGDVAALWACLASVKSCAEVDRCVFRGPAPPCAELASGSFTACDTGGAAVRVKCSAGTTARPVSVEPCVLFGRTCTRLDESRAACTAAEGARCGGGGACRGASATVCTTVGQDQLDLGVDCAGYGGAACASGACAGGAASGGCRPGAAPGVVTCEGDVAHVCAGTTDTPIDCARLGLSCDATRARGGLVQTACVETSDAAPPCRDEDACNGGNLESCASGEVQALDCGAIGLGPCVQLASGAARCSAP